MSGIFSTNATRLTAGFADVEQYAEYVKGVLNPAHSVVTRYLEFILFTPHLQELLQKIVAQLHVLRPMESLIGVRLLTLESLVEYWVKTGARAIEAWNSSRGNHQLITFIPNSNEVEALYSWMMRADTALVNYLNLLFSKSMGATLYTYKPNPRERRNYLAGVLLISSGTLKWTYHEVKIPICHLPVVSSNFCKKIEEIIKNLTQHEQCFDMAGHVHQFGREHGFF